MSALAQTQNAMGRSVPGGINAKKLKAFVKLTQALHQTDLILAYHDRSDGGLITTILEMAFAGRLGLDVDISELGEDYFAALFNEELGAVIQIADDDRSAVNKLLAEYGFRRIDV